MMRARPPGHRVNPKHVVELIKPSLLLYICKYELKKEDRSKNPANVKVLTIYNWVQVMQESSSPLDAEDDEGVKKLRAIKISLSGDNAVRSVQTAFIKIDEIIQHHHLETNEKDIIKWMTWNLGPEKPKRTVENYLRKNNKKARRAGKKLKKFRAYVRKLAERFQDAYDLGIGWEGEGDGKGSGGGGRDGGGGGGGRPPKKTPWEVNFCHRLEVMRLRRIWSTKK